MELPPVIGLAAVLVLVLANGFFVATEFAIVAVRKSRLEELERDGVARAAAARHVVSHLDAYIAATQFGITLASLALGWIGEPALAHLLEEPLAATAGRFAPAAAHGLAIAVAFAVITGLHIVVGELAPKGLALQRPEETTLWVARPIQLFHAVFKWPITALNAIGNAALRLAGLHPASGHQMVHSVDELGLLLTGMQQAGVVDATEARIAKRAFEFGDITAGALMTPRTSMTAFPIDLSVAELLPRALDAGHYRYPVFEGSIDNIVGAVEVIELAKHAAAGAGDASARSFARPPLIVPETIHAAALLERMRRQGCALAILLDEYGGTAGMITLIDLLEALVGSLDAGGPAGTPAPQTGADGSIVLDGRMRVDEFAELADVKIEDETLAAIDTLGGLVVALLGRFPPVGEEVAIDGRRLRVEKRDGLRVAAVKLLPKEPRRQPD